VFFFEIADSDRIYGANTTAIGRSKRRIEAGGVRASIHDRMYAVHTIAIGYFKEKKQSARV